MNERAEKCHAYTASPVWKRRADRFRRGPWWWPGRRNRCQACGQRGGRKGRPNVDVHHIRYTNAFHGKEPTKDLRGLCRADHDRVHDLARTGAWTLAAATDFVIGSGHVVWRAVLVPVVCAVFVTVCLLIASQLIIR